MRCACRTQNSHKLARSLRERDLLLLFIGSVIGSGIFLTPALILRQVGGSVGASLMVWMLGGLLSLLGALTYAELAAVKSGSWRSVLLHPRRFWPPSCFPLWLVPVSGDRQCDDRRSRSRLHKIPPGNFSAHFPAGIAGFGTDDCRRNCRQHLGHAKKFRSAERYYADQSRHHCDAWALSFSCSVASTAITALKSQPLLARPCMALI